MSRKFLPFVNVEEFIHFSAFLGIIYGTPTVITALAFFAYHHLLGFPFLVVSFLLESLIIAWIFVLTMPDYFVLLLDYFSGIESRSIPIQIPIERLLSILFRAFLAQILTIVLLTAFFPASRLLVIFLILPVFFALIIFGYEEAYFQIIALFTKTPTRPSGAKKELK